jgi:hypothetical protein
MSNRDHSKLPAEFRAEDRRERLANALRSNLQKRKALARAREKRAGEQPMADDDLKANRSQ